MRALGAAPHQIRRLIAGEALIVSLVAGVLGLLAGRPLAGRSSRCSSTRCRPDRVHTRNSWMPLAAALGGAVLIPLAVFAAARRARRTRPAEALRDAAIERPRPSVLQIVTGLLFVGRGVAMALIFKGMWAIAFAILIGLVLAVGVACSGACCSACPRCSPARCADSVRRACSRARAYRDRWRTAALATPIVLVAMLAGTQAIVQSSSQQDVERVSEARSPRPTWSPAPTARRSRRCDIRHRRRADLDLPGDALGEDAPWPAAGYDARGRRRSTSASGSTASGATTSPSAACSRDCTCARRHVRSPDGRHVASHVARRGDLRARRRPRRRDRQASCRRHRGDLHQRTGRWRRRRATSTSRGSAPPRTTTPGRCGWSSAWPRCSRRSR